MITKEIALFTLLSITAAAQTLPASTTATPAAETLPPAFTSADTVQALHRLFQNRRTIGAIFLGTTGGVIVASNIAISNDPFLRSAADNALIATGVALIYTAPLLIIGASHLTRFSKKKEEQVVAEFTANHVLSAKLRKRLKPNLFVQQKQRR